MKRRRRKKGFLVSLPLPVFGTRGVALLLPLTRLESLINVSNKKNRLRPRTIEIEFCLFDLREPWIAFGKELSLLKMVFQARKKERL